MERKELVSKALEAGITKAHTMKSVVLEEMLAGMVKVEKTGKRGRPVNEDSVRQKRLIELEEKRVNGTLKLGRAINPDSVRQKRLAEMELKRANGELRRGRPKMNKSDNNEVAA